MNITCKACGGGGDDCKKCNGEGRIEAEVPLLQPGDVFTVDLGDGRKFHGTVPVEAPDIQPEQGTRAPGLTTRRKK